MKKQLLLSVIAALPLAALCQTTLTASMAPPVNSIFTFYDANVPSPAFTFSKSGINNTWDFTGLFASSLDEDTTYVVDPQAVPSVSINFPTASYCTYDDGIEPDFNVVQVDNSALTFLGILTIPFGTGYVPLPAQPPTQTMTFPYTYPQSLSGNTYIQLYATGAQIGQPTIDSARSKSTIQVQADVIAAGDLVVPSGTFPSLLRREVKTQYDTIWVKGAASGGLWVVLNAEVTQDSSFYWYSNQSLIPYAHALYDDTGLHDVHYFKQSSGTTININTSEAVDIVVYPNPVTETLKIKGLVAGVNYSVAIYNAEGKLSMQGTANGNSINVSLLPKGVYTLSVNDNKGTVIAKNFIKQ